MLDPIRWLRNSRPAAAQTVLAIPLAAPRGNLIESPLLGTTQAPVRTAPPPFSASLVACDGCLLAWVGALGWQSSGDDVDSLTTWLTSAGARSAEGTTTGHKNAEGMACRGVRVERTVRQLLRGAASEACSSAVACQW